MTGEGEADWLDEDELDDEDDPDDEDDVPLDGEDEVAVEGVEEALGELEADGEGVETEELDELELTTAVDPENFLCDDFVLEDLCFFFEDLCFVEVAATVVGLFWVLVTSPGSRPAAIWKKMTAHARTKMASEVATTRRLMMRTRRRRSRSTGLIPRSPHERVRGRRLPGAT